jgi:hypothetical protein
VWALMCRSLSGTTRTNGRHHITVFTQQPSTPMFEPASWLGVTKIETPLSFLYIYIQSNNPWQISFEKFAAFFFVTFKIPSNTANNISEDQSGCVFFLFRSILSFKKYATSVFQAKLEINTYKTFHTCYHSTIAKCYTDYFLG